MTGRHISGLSELAAPYRGFIVDLWGVIHDGVTAYPGALACLQALRARGGKVVLLSNAPRRAAAAAAALDRLGVARDLYDAVVTSGEATWMALAEYEDARVYHLGPDRDRNVMDGRRLTLVADPGAADLLLNTGPDDFREPTSVARFLPELRACLAAGLPMICANPDLQIVSAGRRLICAGALGEWYAAAGGFVRWIGKPEPGVYDLVWPLLGDLARAQILAIGDALRTDIAGAKAVGIDSCWVLGGVHAHETAAAAWEEAAAACLAPVATVAALTW